MLKAVKFQNWKAESYTYAPPIQDAVINTDEITSVRQHDPGRGNGPFVKISFNNGDTMICQGRPSDFLERTAKP